jgi:hypothetical protein
MDSSGSNQEPRPGQSKKKTKNAKADYGSTMRKKLDERRSAKHVIKKKKK